MEQDIFIRLNKLVTTLIIRLNNIIKKTNWFVWTPNHQTNINKITINQTTINLTCRISTQTSVTAIMKQSNKLKIKL